MGWEESGRKNTRVELSIGREFQRKTMRNLIMSTARIIMIVLIVFAGSVVLSVLLDEPEWLGRAGSLITILGLLLMVKHNLLCVATDLNQAIIEKLHHNTPPPKPGTALYEHEMERARRIVRDETLGFFIMLAGTVIWGYGDLLIGLII